MIFARFNRHNDDRRLPAALVVPDWPQCIGRVAPVDLPAVEGHEHEQPLAALRHRYSVTATDADGRLVKQVQHRSPVRRGAARNDLSRDVTKPSRIGPPVPSSCNLRRRTLRACASPLRHSVVSPDSSVRNASTNAHTCANASSTST